MMRLYKRARWSLLLWITSLAFACLAVLIPAAITGGQAAWAGSGATAVTLASHHEPASRWHNCSSTPTARLIDGEVYHNDPYGTSQRSCITVRDGRLTIDTSYQPRGTVVAYDSIEIGNYPYSRDPQAGLPARVRSVHTVLRVRMSAGPGNWLGDADIWFGHGSITGPVSHIREMIIANRWTGFRDYCDPTRVRLHGHIMFRVPRLTVRARIAHRVYHAGACMTGGGSSAHLLIRFFAAHQSATARDPLAGFFKFSIEHGWIQPGMIAESAGYAPECWSGCRKVSYMMQATR